MTIQRDEIGDEMTPAVPAPARPGERALGPRGIGTAVAFDWGLGVELLTLAPFIALGTGPGAPAARLGIPLRLGAAALTLGFSAVTFALGEGMRRGWRPAWLTQIVPTAGITLGGVVAIPATLASLRHGHFGMLVSTSIMLFASPVIFWGLTRPRTRDWIATTTSAAARARHGGRWLIGPLISAIIGGLAVAFSRLY